MSEQSDLPGIGHNNPPSDTDVLLDHLANSYSDVVAKCTNMIEGVDRMGDVTDDNCEQAVAFAKQLKLVGDDVDGRRKTEIDPIDTRRKAVQAFFQSKMIDPLEVARQTVLERLTKFMTAANRDTIKNSYGNSAGLRDDLEIKVVSADSVPPDLWAPNEKAIKDKAKAMFKEGRTVDEIAKAIPGISVVLIRKAVVS